MSSVDFVWYYMQEIIIEYNNTASGSEVVGECP